MQSRGEEVPDVDCPGYWIECKAHRVTYPKKALAQALAATDGRVPVAICKEPRTEPTVTMYLKDWLDLMRVLYG